MASRASAPDPNQKYWVKNEFGRVWGPFGIETVGRVNVGKGEYLGRISVSTDGKTYQPIAEHPAVLQAMERATQEATKRLAQAAAAAEREKRKAATGIADAAAAAARSPSIRSDAPDQALDLNLDLPTPSTTATPRTPPPPPVETSAPPQEGKLDPVTLANLYSRIAGMQLTGKLAVDADDHAYAVFFKKGVPERVEVPRPGEALIDFLVKNNAASEDSLRQALDLAGGPDTDMVDTIVSLGMVPQMNLFPLLGEYGVEMLNRTLSLESGKFGWVEGLVAPAGSFALGRKWDLLCKWARTLPRPVVRRRLGDRATRAIYPSSGAHVAVAELNLNAQEARVAAAFNGIRSPAQVAMESAADPEMVYRVALLLTEAGCVSFGPELSNPGSMDMDQPILEKVSAGAEAPKSGPISGSAIGKVAVQAAAVKAPNPPSKPPAPPPAKPASPPPAAKPPPSVAKPPPPKVATKPAAPAPKSPPATKAAEEVEEIGQLHALLEKWKKANHFEVLGVSEASSPAEIKASYLALARKHHPDTVSDPEMAVLRTVKADLLARVNEAFHVLEEAKSRNEYAASLKEGGQVDVGPILQAEEDFLRATILVKARKFNEAIDLLDRAMQINPNELEFSVWRAFARFSAAKDKSSVYDDAMAQCTRVAKDMPACVAAHQFIGQMAKIQGDAKRSEAAYRKVLELEPNNIEAKRELRNAKG